MELELPRKFEDLVLRETVTGTSLRKRSKEDESKLNEPKLSIKDRIKVREDVKNKRIKVEAAHHEPDDQKTSVKTEGIEKSKKDPAKVRCAFWPGCKKPECPFVHPKEAVN